MTARIPETAQVGAPGIKELPLLRRLPRSGFARWLGVSLLFLAASIIQTWPLVLHSTDSVSDWPLRPEDTWQRLWDLWWVKRSLLGFDNPFHTDLLFYPQGADLYLHTLTIFNGVLSIPLQALTGNVILSANVLSLALFALSGVGAYALSYHVTRNHWAGIVSGYVFAFSPFVVMQYLDGHWNISTTWPIPFFALFLLKFQARGRLRDAAIAGLFWAIIAYTFLEHAVDSGLFLGLLLVYWSFVYIRRKDWTNLPRLWRGAPVIGLVAFILSAPLLVPALLSINKGDVFMPRANEGSSTDLLSLLTPSPLWGPGEYPVLPSPGLNHIPAGDMENTVYLGVTVLILATVAILSIRSFSHRAGFWTLVALFFLALAMGPHLYIGDTKDFSLGGLDFSIPMPYQMYEEVPIIRDRRVIARLVLFGILALSVLAGIGLDTLISWLRRRGRPRLALLAPIVVLGLVVLEFWNPPMAVSKLASAAALNEIGREQGNFTVIHAPLGRSTWTLVGNQRGALLANYYEPMHGKATFGGYLSRAPEATMGWILREPGFRYLSCPKCEGVPAGEDLDRDRVLDVFRRYRVRYVVLHSLDPHGWEVGDSEVQILDGYLRAVLQLWPVYEDDALTVFRLGG